MPVRVNLNGRADRGSGSGHLRPALSINALLAALYLGVRLAAYVGVAAKQYPDSQSYLDVAKARFLGGEFFAGARPWTLPLLYKILPDSDTYRSAGQFVVSVVCWLALAAVTARCVQDHRLRPIAFGVVLLFSLSSSITRWDHLILTESLAVSLTAAVLAAWLAFIRRPTGLSVAAVLLVSLLWAFVRDTNTVLVIFTALFALVAAGIQDRHRTDDGAAILLLGCAIVEFGELLADRDDVAGLAVQRRDAARIGRRDFHHRLVGFDRDERLIDHDVVADGDVPVDDFDFVQAFAEIGEVEDLHEKLTTRRAASTICFSLGI